MRDRGEKEREGEDKPKGGYEEVYGEDKEGE
jgi:hypothetical protein